MSFMYAYMWPTALPAPPVPNIWIKRGGAKSKNFIGTKSYLQKLGWKYCGWKRTSPRSPFMRLHSWRSRNHNFFSHCLSLSVSCVFGFPRPVRCIFTNFLHLMTFAFPIGLFLVQSFHPEGWNSAQQGDLTISDVFFTSLPPSPPLNLLSKSWSPHLPSHPLPFSNNCSIFDIVIFSFSSFHSKFLKAVYFWKIIMRILRQSAWFCDKIAYAVLGHFWPFLDPEIEVWFILPSETPPLSPRFINFIKNWRNIYIALEEELCLPSISD